MNYIYIVLLTCSQFVIGYSIVSIYGKGLNLLQQLTLSLIAGMGIVSLVPAVLQLLYVPLTALSIFSSIGALTIIFFITTYRQLKSLNFKELFGYKVKLYEWPWLMLICAMMFIAICNSVLLPPTPRDLLSGPEPIAHFALTEHTFINSVYEQDMPFNNGPFKSLYIPSLQLIYKLIGFSMGKVWMVILSISFLGFLYTTLRVRYLHPVLAGACIALYVFTPELFPYSYLVLYDYSNMIFFFLALYSIRAFIREGDNNAMLQSAIFAGIATYIRPETLILVFMVAAFVLIANVVTKRYSVRNMIPILVFGIFSTMVYFFTSYLYLNHYLPVHYDVEAVVNSNPANLTPLVKRLKDITFTLIYSPWGLLRYGYIFVIATIILVAEFALYRRLSVEARYWAMMFLLVYLGIAIIGYLLPLADLVNTTKRALFKLVPIALMYIASSNNMQQASAKLYRVFSSETGTTQTAASQVRQTKGKKRKK